MSWASWPLRAMCGIRPDGSPWSCRVVANPLGYLKRGEQEDFRPDLVIEVPSR